MDKRAINPSTWLLQFGINQGVEVTGSERTLYLSGQTSTNSDGEVMHAGDLAAQFKYAWENLVQVLKESGMEPGNIVRLNLYTTDVDELMSNGAELFGLIAKSGCVPTATLLGVARLYDPTIMVELEATAVA